MQISQDSMYQLKVCGCVYMRDEEGEPVIVVKELDEKTADAMRHSPYGKGIRLSKDKAQVFRAMYRLGWYSDEEAHSKQVVVDREDVSVISNASPELKEHSNTIIRALKHDEKMFLESYGSEEEFTVAANIHRERYRLVKLSFNFDGKASKKCAAVWEERP